MANVLFKQGTQDKLDQIRSAKSATEGTFYLTNDSHRMYLGIANGDAVPVNEGVTTVPSLDDLPKSAAHLHVGQFYYVTAGNILCVFNGKTWAQINSNTDTIVKEVNIDISEVDGVTDAVSLTITLKDQEGNAIESSTKIRGTNGLKVSENPTGEITLTGDKYSLETAYSGTTHIASLKLNSENTDNDTEINIHEGDNIHFTRNAVDGSLELSADNARIDEVVGGFGVGPNDTNEDKVGMYVQVSDDEGNSGTAHLDPIVVVGSEADQYQEVHFKKGKAILPVYSKIEIDKKFVGLDAMSYKGTCGENGSTTLLNTANLHNGDTFLAAGPWSQPIAGVTYKAKKGDMIICRGTESATGVIDPTTLIIDVVPSGDDALADTTYVVVPTDNGFKITDMSGSNIGGMTVNGDNKYLEVTDSKNTTDGTNTLTVKHKTITSAATTDMVSAGDNKIQQYGETLSVPVIESIKRDAAGHVTEVKVRNYQLKDTNGHLVSEADYEATVTDGKVIIGSKVHMKTSDGTAAGTAAGAFSIESKSLTIGAVGTAAVTLELEWGTF